MIPFKALLIGSDPGLLQMIPNLLTRARFTVDVISQSALLQHTHQIKDLVYARSDEALLALAEKQISKHYDLVIIGDDITLRLILQSNLPAQTKLKLLPVTSENHYSHLFSKIGLSQAFEAGKVLTPQYGVANSASEFIPLANSLGYPVLIKVDASFGGQGVFVCQSDHDIANLAPKLAQHPHFRFPVLVQEKIEGLCLDLSAFYQAGKLISFCHAVEEKTTSPLGPSNVRTYTQLGYLDQKIFTELEAVGKALGADGFANISAIWSQTNLQRYFFEADMRPNGWADYSKYVGHDLAGAIKAYFEHGEILHSPPAINAQFPRSLLMAHVSRLKSWELLINRYGVWRFATREQIIRRMFGHPLGLLRHGANRYLQPLFSERMWSIVNQFFSTLKIKLIYLLFR